MLYGPHPRILVKGSKGYLHGFRGMSYKYVNGKWGLVSKLFMSWFSRHSQTWLIFFTILTLLFELRAAKSTKLAQGFDVVKTRDMPPIWLTRPILISLRFYYKSFLLIIVEIVQEMKKSLFDLLLISFRYNTQRGGVVD